MKNEYEAVIGLRAVINGLVNHKQIGACHTELKTAFRRLKNSSPAARKSIEKFCKKSGWFIHKQNNGQAHISLDPKRISEWQSFLTYDNAKALLIFEEKIS